MDTLYFVDFLAVLAAIAISFIIRHFTRTRTKTDEKPNTSIPTINRVSPPPDDDGSDTVTEGDDDDIPPAFPSLTSPQRVQPLPKPSLNSQLMPPPPLPQRLGVDHAVRPIGVSSSLRVLETKKRPPKPSRKVALAPGHSTMDWANLKKSGKDLRGVNTLSRITPSLLKKHNKPDDAWAAIHGKVYNITPFLSFHPGGDREIMRVAGRDGTKLFTLTHSWVSADMMLDACLVGFLVPEPSS